MFAGLRFRRAYPGTLSGHNCEGLCGGRLGRLAIERGRRNVLVTHEVRDTGQRSSRVGSHRDSCVLKIVGADFSLGQPSRSYRAEKVRLETFARALKEP